MEYRAIKMKLLSISEELKFIFHCKNIALGPTDSLGLVLAMYISSFLCQFHLCWVANAKAISDGIWALVLYKLFSS